jgi:superfamily II DNA helicase RecQ
VCTLIDDSDEVVAQAAQTTFEMLSAALPHVRVGLVHGRMKAAEKQATMRAFKEGALDLLVATTVIEVGVDVPNASLMIIENAERLGLSQLHQLRGRVGRGSAVSSCVLLYQSPLSLMAKQRLETMRETNDGFVIAEKTCNCAARANCSARSRRAWLRSASPTWSAMPRCCRRCARSPTVCSPTIPRSPIVSSTVGSVARPVTLPHKIRTHDSHSPPDRHRSRRRRRARAPDGVRRSEP